MFHRLTQTEDYWVQDFTVAENDLDNINNLLLEEERPLPIENLVLAIMRQRVEREQAELQRLLSKGQVYQPAGAFEVGTALVLPAFNFASATVTGLRQGYNPEYGEFQVIEVQFERTGRKREFAAGLTCSHALNTETDKLLSEDTSLKTVEELMDQYGWSVETKLTAALARQTALIELFGRWFLKALLTEIGPGYLNIAEAVLDIAGGGPLRTDVLLRDLDLPAEARPELLDFSLSYALFHDGRFDEVGPAGEVLWYLRRLEPPDVLNPPKRLVYQSVAYDHDLLNLNLRRLAQDLDDEWSVGWHPGPEAQEVTFTLTYPHLQRGTIPLSSAIAPLFPTSFQAPRIRFTVIDGHSDQEMEAWVVWEGRFVYGLKEWYERNDLSIGAFLTIRPGPATGTAIIEIQARRPQSEWIRVALVEGARLAFGMQKRSIGYSYDDMMMIAFDDHAGADALWIRSEEQRWSLAQLMVKLFPELAKLSPQSTVHAKTVYSAVNIIRRCPPGPIFAELVRQPCFVSMGENYWRYNASLWSGE